MFYEYIQLAISLCISFFTFGYLFYWMNYRFELFKQIQCKAATLNKNKKFKLGTTIFITLIGFFILYINESSISYGFTLGMLISFRDTCINQNVIDICKRG